MFSWIKGKVYGKSEEPTPEDGQIAAKFGTSSPRMSVLTSDQKGKLQHTRRMRRILIIHRLPLSEN